MKQRTKPILLNMPHSFIKFQRSSILLCKLTVLESGLLALPPHNMFNYRQATFYWLSCCLQKANALLCPLHSKEFGHPILHKELTNMLSTANTKLQYIIDNNKFE